MSLVEAGGILNRQVVDNQCLIGRSDDGRLSTPRPQHQRLSHAYTCITAERAKVGDTQHTCC